MPGFADKHPEGVVGYGFIHNLAAAGRAAVDPEFGQTGESEFMFSKNWRWLRIVPAGIAFALAALVAQSQPTSAADKITVGALRFTSHAASFVAFERSYFKKQGLEVELKFFQAAQPMAVAIATALKLTRKDRPMISSNSAFNSPINSKASEKDPTKSCIISRYCTNFVNYAISIASKISSRTVQVACLSDC